MSHQNQGRSLATLFHFQALKTAISWLWQDINFRGIRLRDDCTWLVNAYTEAQWSLLGLWAMALHAQHFQQSQGLDPNRLSCAGMLRAYRRAMREYKSRPEAGEDLHSLLLLAQKDNYQRTKPKTNEDYPRYNKLKPAGRPKIKNPSAWQIMRAKQIKLNRIT